MYLLAQVTLLQCFGFSHTFFWQRKEPNCYLCCCCGVDAFTFRRSVECNMNEWTESCRACCHFPLYMLCSCHALTNPAGPLFDTLPSTCLLMCLRTFRVRSQWQNWLIVSFMLMCLLNPVNVWSCVQNKCYVSTFPLLHSRCKNAWVCKSLALLIWSYLPLISALFCHSRYGGISVGGVNSQVHLNESAIEDAFRDITNLLSSFQVLYILDISQSQTCWYHWIIWIARRHLQGSLKP